MLYVKNHVSAWQCSPELSISPRSHETVQNIRRDLMYGGVGAANFQEFHSFSRNSLNSPKFHRISWFCLNFMKFMKMLKFQQKRTFSRPAAETSMIPKEFYRFGRSTFTPKCKFPWKSWFLLKMMENHENHHNFKKIMKFHHFTVILHFWAMRDPQIPMEFLREYWDSRAPGRKSWFYPPKHQKAANSPKMVKFHENTNNFMDFMIFHGLGG